MRTKARTKSHPNLKITDAQLRQLRYVYRMRYGQWGIKTELADRFGVSVARISTLVADIDRHFKSQMLKTNQPLPSSS